MFYREDNLISLDADAVQGIKSWRFTQGGATSRAIARGGSGGGLGYTFQSQPQVCFCEGNPCKHIDFTGTPSAHTVLPVTQEKTDREQATDFMGSIRKGTPLASKGDLDDSTAGGEPLWFSIAKDSLQVCDERFQAAGGAGTSGTRTINMGWSYVEITWLVKIKTDSAGDVHYEEWLQPHGEKTVLTKPKILTVPIEWQRVEETRNGRKRYILSAATYQRLVDAVSEK